MKKGMKKNIFKKFQFSSLYVPRDLVVSRQLVCWRQRLRWRPSETIVNAAADTPADDSGGPTDSWLLRWRPIWRPLGRPPVDSAANARAGRAWFGGVVGMRRSEGCVKQRRATHGVTMEGRGPVRSEGRRGRRRGPAGGVGPAAVGGEGGGALVGRGAGAAAQERQRAPVRLAFCMWRGQWPRRDSLGPASPAWGPRRPADPARHRRS